MQKIRTTSQAKLLPSGALVEGYSGAVDFWVVGAPRPLVAARFPLREEGGLGRGGEEEGDDDGGEADGGGDHDERRRVRLHALIEGPRSRLI